jgi:hypothetical protein
VQTSWADYPEYTGPGLGEPPDSSDVDSDIGPVVNEAEVRRYIMRRQSSSSGRECVDASGNTIRLQNLKLSDVFDEQPSPWIRPARTVPFSRPHRKSRRGKMPPVSDDSGPSSNRFGVLERSELLASASVVASPVPSPRTVPVDDVSVSGSLPKLQQDSSDSVSQSVSDDGSGW